jgi:predicted transcriptional regulator
MPNQSSVEDSRKLDLKERGLLSVILEFESIPNWEINLIHIAKEAGISLGTCQKLIAQLIKKGWLKREKIFAPDGIQGTKYLYQVVLNNENQTHTTQLPKIQVDEIQVDKIQPPKIEPSEIQNLKINAHNNNNINKTELNKTHSNKKVVEMSDEIDTMLESVIWKTLEEFENFQNYFLSIKSNELNRPKSEVIGIFKALEIRISKNNITFSDVKLIRDWRNSLSSNEIVQPIIKPSIAKNYSLSENEIAIKIKNAIANKEIIEERYNSAGVRGIQVDYITFVELESWLNSENEIKPNAKALELIANFRQKFKK